jgi:hypothetical protein
MTTISAVDEEEEESGCVDSRAALSFLLERERRGQCGAFGDGDEARRIPSPSTSSAHTTIGTCGGSGGTSWRLGRRTWSG